MSTMTSKRSCEQTLSGRHVFRQYAGQIVCICGERANADEQAAFDAALELVKRERVQAEAMRESRRLA